MLVRSKFFLHFVERMEKLKLSLSKQQSKMLKIKSELLKIRKNVKIIKLEYITRKSFRISRIPEIPMIFGIPVISRSSREIVWKFSCLPGSEKS